MARRVKLSVAKKAVDSTLRRILNYTAEIFMSIILLVLISIPLVFVIPMWFQFVVLGTPRTEVALNPLVWFGFDGALWLTLLLGLISFAITYFAFILKMKPGVGISEEPESIEEEDEPIEEEDVETEDEEVEEEIEIEEEEVEEVEEEEVEEVEEEEVEEE